MDRKLRYVSGVLVTADPFDRELWHTTIRRQRYSLRLYRNSIRVAVEGGPSVGRFPDWNAAVAAVMAHGIQAGA